MAKVSIKRLPDDVLAEAQAMASPWFDELVTRADSLFEQTKINQPSLTEARRRDITLREMMRRTLIEVQGRSIIAERAMTKRLDQMQRDLAHLQRNNR